MREQNKYFVPMVQQQIGNYKFKSLHLLEQAFTRRSYTEENGGENNEVLEFIGDRVLDIAVTRYLIEKYGTDVNVQDKIPDLYRTQQEPDDFKCKLSEGELTQIKQKIVQKKALARRMEELDLMQFVRMGKGDDLNDVNQKDSVKEDTFEAILGAVALDSNWNFETIQNVAMVMVCPDSFVDDESDDYVSMIYEWNNKRHGCQPHFKYLDTTFEAWMYSQDRNVVGMLPQGTYECNHFNKTCLMKLVPGDKMPVFRGFGESNNRARKAACRTAYEYLKEKGLLLSIKDELDNPNIQDAINQLEILSRRGYFSIPEYDYKEDHDKNGNPVWSVECRIAEYEQVYKSCSSSKKQAKKHAAYDMLKYVLSN